MKTKAINIEKYDNKHSKVTFKFKKHIFNRWQYQTLILDNEFINSCENYNYFRSMTSSLKYVKSQKEFDDIVQFLSCIGVLDSYLAYDIILYNKLIKGEFE